MRKTILYRLFKIGGIPKKLRPVLEAEKIILFDEGIGGWFITRNLKAPGKRFKYRREGFSGFLAITKKRIIAYTFWKRQINISVEDPKISELFVQIVTPQSISISFESSVFNRGWQGAIELRFNTSRAPKFYEVLRHIGVSQGAAPGASKRPRVA